METYKNLFFVIWTLSFLCSATYADNVTDGFFTAATTRVQSLYSDHARFVAAGYSVAKGEIGSAHFYRGPVSPLIAKLYVDSLITVVACAVSYRAQYPTLGYNLTNYEKAQKFCDAFDSHVELEKKCNLVYNNGACNPSYPYRTIDGYCNNLKYPKWGAQLTPYGRLIAGNFDDGARSPRVSTYNYQSLPQPRILGNSLFYNPVPTVQSKSNYLSILFGQYIAHDLGERVYYQLAEGGPDFQVCTSDNAAALPVTEQAFGAVVVEIPPNDPYLSKYGVGCLDFVRTQPMYRNDCKFSGAEFANNRTHYLDSSNIYGSVTDIAAYAREFKYGKLKINKQKIMHQKAKDANTQCDYDCYVAVEDRAVPFYTLAIIHSIFMRLHNNIAEELLKLNSKWDDEKLYQESRRIVIALYQNVVYNEWIPTFLGADYAAKNKLNSFESPYCGTYNEEVDPSASNEFSHAAFRQFHMNIPDKFNFYDASLRRYATVPLYETDNGPTILENEYNGVLRGLLNDPSIAGTSSFSDTMRNKIFDNYNAKKLGMDIPSNDILVGRDQGLSPYHKYLEKYFGVNVRTWDDLSVTISKKYIDKLKTIYAGVNDTDLFIGLSLENRDDENYKYVGLVGKFILGEQFKRSKFGDRFFYCLRNNGNPFTTSQLTEINQTSLAQIICQVVDIEGVLLKAFQTPSSTNAWTSCKQFKPINLNAWKVK